MIILTHFRDGSRVALNPDLVEKVEETPDTVVTLTTGARYLVQERLDEIVARVEQHRARIAALAQQLGADVSPGTDDGGLRLIHGAQTRDGEDQP